MSFVLAMDISKSDVSFDCTDSNKFVQKVLFS
jgi:hypothetical protein